MIKVVGFFFQCLHMVFKGKTKPDEPNDSYIKKDVMFENPNQRSFRSLRAPS